MSDEAKTAWRIWMLVRFAVLVLMIVGTAYGVTKFMRTEIESFAGQPKGQETAPSRNVVTY